MNGRVFAMAFLALALATSPSRAQTPSPPPPSSAAAPVAPAPPPPVAAPAPPPASATAQLSDDDKAFIRSALRTQGCSFVEMNGTTITATCAAPNGDQVESKLDVAPCTGMDLKVVEGSMACIGKPLAVQRAAPPPPPRPVAAPPPPPPPPPPTDTIVLYSKAKFQGRSTPEISKAVPDLGTYNFRNTTGSVTIKGTGRWELCDKVDFGGKCVTVSGSQDSLLNYGLKNDISSVRPAQ